MPIITKIQSQKKRAGFYNIFVDGTFFCSLSDLQLATLGLKNNQDISKKELSDIKNSSALSKTYDRALYYLQYGPRTVSQMQKYLLQKDFDEDVVQLTIERLIKDGYLNDLNYCLSFISTRQQLRPRSSMVLKKELLAKDINKDIIEQAISESEDVDNNLAIKKIIDKKIKQSKYQDKNKMLQYLSQQGFSYSEAKNALDEISFWQ